MDDLAPSRTPGYWKKLLALVGLLVVVKSLFVISLADVFVHGGELVLGAGAKAVLDLDAPSYQLALDYRQGGTLATMHLTALAFWLFGPSIFVHKLVAGVSCILTLWAGFTLLSRHFGQRAGVFFGVFFIFGPSSFQKLTLLNLGGHVSATVFALLILDWGLRVLTKQAPSRREFLALGLVSGLGVFYDLMILPVVLFVGVTLACGRFRLIRSPRGLYGLLGFLVGLAPLILILCLTGPELFTRPPAELGAPEHAVLDLSRGQNPSSRWESGFYSLLALLSFVYLVRSEPHVRWRSAIFLTLTIPWVAIYFAAGYAYQDLSRLPDLARAGVPWILFTIIAAVALSGATSSRRKLVRNLGWGISVATLLLGLFNAGAIIAEGRPRQPIANTHQLFGTRGYLHTEYFTRILPQLQGNMLRKLILLKTLRDDPRLLYPEIASAGFAEDYRGYAEVAGTAIGLGEEQKDEILRGFGTYMAKRFDWSLDTMLEGANRAPFELGPVLTEAIGRFGAGYSGSLQGIEERIERELNRPHFEAFMRGLGFGLYRNLVLGRGSSVDFILKPEACAAFIQRQPEVARAHLMSGFALARELHELR